MDKLPHTTGAGATIATGAATATTGAGATIATGTRAAIGAGTGSA